MILRGAFDFQTSRLKAGIDVPWYHRSVCNPVALVGSKYLVRWASHNTPRNTILRHQEAFQVGGPI